MTSKFPWRWQNDRFLAEATVQSQAEARIKMKVKTWYDEHLVQFRVSEADLAMIMVSTEEDATPIKEQLDGGADFAALVKKEKSEDPRTKDKGGAMGTMDLEEMPPTIKEPIENAKDGDVIGPIDPMGKFAISK